MGTYDFHNLLFFTFLLYPLFDGVVHNLCLHNSKQSFTVTLPTVSIRMQAKLFGPLEDEEGLPNRKRVAQILTIRSDTSGDLKFDVISSGRIATILLSLIKRAYGIFRSTLFNTVDGYVLRMLNERLETYHMNPLFVPNETQSETSAIDSKGKSIVQEDYSSDSIIRINNENDMNSGNNSAIDGTKVKKTLVSGLKKFVKKRNKNGSNE